MDDRKKLCIEIAYLYKMVMDDVNPHIKYLYIIAIDRVISRTKHLNIKELKDFFYLEGYYFDTRQYKKMSFSLAEMFFW